MSNEFSAGNYLRNPIRTFRLRYIEYRRFRPWKGLVKRRLKNSRLKMFLDPEDVGLSRDVFVYGSREDAAKARLEDLLGHGGVILDIGSNIGYFVLLEAKLVGKEGKIFAIEPAPKNIEILKKNVELNGFEERVHITHGAVGREDGEATLHLATRSNLHTMTRVKIMDNYVKFKGTVKVPVFSIDSFVENMAIDVGDIRLIRMDIEGYEYEAFLGMQNTLDAVSDLLVFVEVHPKLIRASAGEEGLRAFVDLLKNQGFAIVGASHSLSSRVDEDFSMANLDEILQFDEAIELFLHKS